MMASWKAAIRAVLLGALAVFGARAQGNPPAPPSGPVVLSTTDLNFGNQYTGTASASQSIYLTKTVPYPLTQSSFLTSGSNATDFTVTTTCGTYLMGGCSFTVIFTPSILGPETAILTFSDVDTQTGISYGQGVALRGTGAPAAVASPTSLYFASLFSGGPSGTQTIAVNNASSDALNQGSFLLSGPNASDFAVTTTCGTTFTAYGTCSVSVRFTPATPNNETATLTFTDADAKTGIPYTQSIALNGTAVPGLSAGVVEIISEHSGKALDVVGTATTDGVLIDQEDFSGRNDQLWQLVVVESGFYKIQNFSSGKVLDVMMASTENGAEVQQWTYLGTDNQKWQLTPVADGSFQIVNKGSGKLLDVTGLSMQDGTTMQQWAATGGDNQKWMITAQQYFSVTSRDSGKALDDTGFSLQDGSPIQQWQFVGGDNQLWQFMPLGNGFYEIVNRLSGKALDAGGPAQPHAVSGALVEQYEFSGYDNQQWKLVPTGSGYYTIANKSSGNVLDVIGLSTSDGAGIQVYTNLGGSNQQWRLDPVSP